jgi:hypothetical protein
MNCGCHVIFKDAVPVILEEDVEMSGFFPLLTLPTDTLQTISDASLVRLSIDSYFEFNVMFSHL